MRRPYWYLLGCTVQHLCRAKIELISVPDPVLMPKHNNGMHFFKTEKSQLSIVAYLDVWGMRNRKIRYKEKLNHVDSTTLGRGRQYQECPLYWPSRDSYQWPLIGYNSWSCSPVCALILWSDTCDLIHSGMHAVSVYLCVKNTYIENWQHTENIHTCMCLQMDAYLHVCVRGCEWNVQAVCLCLCMWERTQRKSKNKWQLDRIILCMGEGM